jgi:hypothetical protein
MTLSLSLLTFGRGLVEIDRARLEEATCESYDIIRGATDRIVPHDVMESHPHFASADKLHVV